ARGRGSREETDLLSLETGIGKTLNARERLIALAVNENVRGVIIGIGIVDQAGALGIAHDEIASIAPHGVGNVARRLREPTISHSITELIGNKRCELVFEPLALLLGEGHVVRVGANTQNALRPGTVTARQAESDGKEGASSAQQKESHWVLAKFVMIPRPLKPHLFGAMGKALS